MDDDTTELIKCLCTQVGMIMEDASVVALTVGGKDPGNSQAAIEELDRAARQITALISAARALLT